MENNMEQLQYPVGRFKLPAAVSATEIDEAITRIKHLPAKLRQAFRQLPGEKYDTPYRPAGWTSRQVIHHCADSHMNAFCRFKLALTEDAPVIKPYLQHAWAEQVDYQLDPEISLGILEGLHTRWGRLMDTMTEMEWDRTFVHPEYNRVYSLRQTAMLYAWHGEHHLGHVLNVAEGVEEA